MLRCLLLLWQECEYIYITDLDYRCICNIWILIFTRLFFYISSQKNSLLQYIKKKLYLLINDNSNMITII